MFVCVCVCLCVFVCMSEKGGKSLRKTSWVFLSLSDCVSIALLFLKTKRHMHASVVNLHVCTHMYPAYARNYAEFGRIWAFFAYLCVFVRI